MEEGLAWKLVHLSVYVITYSSAQIVFQYGTLNCAFLQKETG